MKNTLTLIILILLSKTIAAQQIDSLVFQKISKQLVDRYLADYASNDDIERRGDCIYGKEGRITQKTHEARKQELTSPMPFLEVDILNRGDVELSR